MAIGLDNPCTGTWFGVSTCCQLLWGFHLLAIALGIQHAGNWFGDSTCWHLVWIIHLRSHGLAFPPAVNWFGESTRWQLVWGSHLLAIGLGMGIHFLAIGTTTTSLDLFQNILTKTSMFRTFKPRLVIGLGIPRAGSWLGGIQLLANGLA